MSLGRCCNCGRWMPAGAMRCPEPNCHALQSEWRNLPWRLVGFGLRVVAFVLAVSLVKWLLLLLHLGG